MNNEQVQEIFVEDIIPNRFQPRLNFDEKTLQELSNSIKEHGIIQPIVLRRLGNKFEIIAGERRYKAACMAGLKKVPAIVKEMSDNESAEVALIENVQRKNLTSIEEAQSYKNLLDRGYLTQESLAQKLGVSQSTIANKLRLLNLCDEVQNALLNEQISERHARSLLQLEKYDDQKAMLKRIIDERLTVKKLDDEIKKLLNGDQSSSDEGESVDMEDTTKKNIFGISLEPPTDLEKEETNLSVGEEVTPFSFNPFSQSSDSPDLAPVASVEESSIPSTPDMMVPPVPEVDNSGFNNLNVNITPEVDNVDNQEEPTITLPVGLGNEDIVNPMNDFNSVQVNGPEVPIEPSVDVSLNNPSFNPFGGSLNTEKAVSVEEQASDPIETFDIFGDVIPAQSVDNTLTQPAEPEVIKKSIGEEISKVRDTVNNIKSDRFDVDVEEYDFEDMYQIILKIKK